MIVVMLFYFSAEKYKFDFFFNFITLNLTIDEPCGLTTSVSRNKYILTVKDYFTKSVDLCGLRLKKVVDIATK